MVKLSSSTWSPILVPVPCASTSVIVLGSIPDDLKSCSSVSACPAAEGTYWCFFASAPSLPTALPRIVQSILSLSRLASDSTFRIATVTPSDITVPVADLENGLQWPSKEYMSPSREKYPVSSAERLEHATTAMSHSPRSKLLRAQCSATENVAQLFATVMHGPLKSRSRPKSKDALSLKLFHIMSSSCVPSVFLMLWSKYVGNSTPAKHPILPFLLYLTGSYPASSSASHTICSRTLCCGSIRSAWNADISNTSASNISFSVTVPRDPTYFPSTDALVSFLHGRPWVISSLELIIISQSSENDFAPWTFTRIARIAIGSSLEWCSPPGANFMIGCIVETCGVVFQDILKEIDLRLWGIKIALMSTCTPDEHIFS